MATGKGKKRTLKLEVGAVMEKLRKTDVLDRNVAKHVIFFQKFQPAPQTKFYKEI